ncbi:MAG: peptide chain release factor 1 [Candidatus Aerophobetes bacterium]|nr:peptide chain release factor 1 [Candidatus Aerophobetes bacterium]
MNNKLEGIKNRYQELKKLLSEPRILADTHLVEKYSKEYREIEKVVFLWRKYREIAEEIKKMDGILKDAKEEDEVKELAKEEKNRLDEQLKRIKKDLEESLTEEERYSKRNVIMEIRAGTGGEEASLFAADLYKMYLRFGEKKDWRIENITLHPTSRGGFREVIFAVEGKEVFKNLRYESGVHRVQRVPVTESSGRIHTSTVTVAVLPEPEEIEIEVNPEDLRIDTFHSQGAGGQHVNVTDSAVRVTHQPTGIVVQCQDERSQHQNRAKAIRVLRAKLLQNKGCEQQKEISEQRKNQIGKGERAERIRTYNFPQSRVTDHRIHLTLHNIESILNGDMDDLIQFLQRRLKEKKL